jgi:oligosaccharide repeat unit polymerase
VAIRKIRIEPILYIVSCVLISLYPLFLHAKSISKIGVAKYADKNGYIQYFLLFSLPILLWGFAELLFNTLNTRTSSLAMIYEDRELKLKTTTIGHICVGYTRLFEYLWPILFFYCISLKGFYAKIAYIALLGTFCMCIDGYVTASRAAIIRQVMYFIVIFYLCKNRLSLKFVSRFKKVGVVFLCIIVSFLMLITVSRFSSGNNKVDLLTWMSLYSGEGVLRFCQHIWDLSNTSYGDTNFSFIKDLMGLDTYTNLLDRRDYYELHFGIPTKIFYTYVGDLCIDFGKYWTLFFLCLLSIGINMLIKASIRRRYYTFIDVYLLGLYILMIVYGVMYFFCKTYISQSKVFIGLIIISLMQTFLLQRKSIQSRG